MKNSSRHHFIPEYYIKGFTDSSGLVYIYDKVKDEILRKKYSPKQIMFEWNRNTLSFGKNKTSIIEDVWFKQLDSELSKTIYIFRNEENTEDLHSIDNTAMMQFFIINQIWRLPKYDVAFEFLFKNSLIVDSDGKKIEVKEGEEMEILKSLERTKFPSKIINEIRSFKPAEKIMSKTFGRSQPEFVLGDYPILFKNQPLSTEQILYSELFIPISSQRLYSISSNDDLSFDFEDSVKINTLIIHQSQQFICSHSKEFLQKSIAYYKEVRKIVPIESLKSDIFK